MLRWCFKQCGSEPKGQCGFHYRWCDTDDQLFDDNTWALGSSAPLSISWCSVTVTHWGRVTHIYVSNLTITGSDNGLSPDRRQAIIWTNARILLIGPLGTNFSEILIEILTFSFKKIRLKVSSAKRRPFCLSLDVLTHLPHWIRWPAFRRRYFHIHFLECANLD